MSEFWIVASADRERHDDPSGALAELEALKRSEPNKAFRIFRCKRYMQPAQHFPKMVALLRDIVAQGLTRDCLDRARVLLGTVDHRNGPKKVGGVDA